jgi:hypothetical protein
MPIATGQRVISVKLGKYNDEEYVFIVRADNKIEIKRIHEGKIYNYSSLQFESIDQDSSKD